MKKILAAAALATVAAASGAQAETNYMLGVTWTLGGGSPEMGVSGRVLSSNDSSDFGFGGGVTYYVQSGQIGYDAVAGYMQGDVMIGGGYDFASFQPVFTLGYYQ